MSQYQYGWSNYDSAQDSWATPIRKPSEHNGFAERKDSSRFNQPIIDSSLCKNLFMNNANNNPIKLNLAQTRSFR